MVVILRKLYLYFILFFLNFCCVVLISCLILKWISIDFGFVYVLFCSSISWLFNCLAVEIRRNRVLVTIREVFGICLVMSGDDSLIKIRKPYTISKQRERWSDDEHTRFLEALKLHGRAWQRIEEHIGTKNAVQIRSHAQKFFSKLEKDAIVKGVPISKTIEIDIPPPRPKRKPSNPYPRKTCDSTLQADTKEKKRPRSASSSHPANSAPDLEKLPAPEKSAQAEEPVYSNENQDDDFGTTIFTNFQEAPSTSVSSVDKNTRLISLPLQKSGSFRDFMPSSMEESNQDEPNASYFPIKSKCIQKLDNDAVPTDEMQAAQHYPRHVPVHILEGSSGTSGQTSLPEISYQESAFQHPIHGLPGLSNIHEANAKKSAVNQAFPMFPPFNLPMGDKQEDYQSFVQFSSAFSSLIMSNLLQNPAAHAAASLAASFQSIHLNQAPSIAAMAAATVAAATAWWAANGLLPICPPLHNAFPCTAPAAPSMETNQSPPLQDQSLDAECNEALKAKDPPSELPFASSSGREESGVGKIDMESKAVEQEKSGLVTEPDEANKTKNRKQVDCSSCGSNTPSSSDDVETDAKALEKHEEAMEEPNEPDTCQRTTSDFMNMKNPYNVHDYCKEVSEEGRIAFKELFTRQVLPQSFSPTLGMKDKHQNQNFDGKSANPSLLDLNTNAWGSFKAQGIENRGSSLTPESNEDGLLTMSLGLGKSKARRTGFYALQ